MSGSLTSDRNASTGSRRTAGSSWQGGGPVCFVPERSRGEVKGDTAYLQLTVALNDHPLTVTVHTQVRDGNQYEEAEPQATLKGEDLMSSGIVVRLDQPFSSRRVLERRL